MLNPELSKLYTSEVIESLEYAASVFEPMDINPIVWGVSSEYKGIVAPYGLLYEEEREPEDLTLINTMGAAFRIASRNLTPEECEWFYGIDISYPKAAWEDLVGDEVQNRLWI